MSGREPPGGMEKRTGTPAGELRDAARLMRERAGGVPRDWCLIGSQIVAVGTEALPGTDVIGTCMIPERAAYVASMSPDFALAVADWLDAAAKEGAYYEAGGAQLHPGSYALKVARAYLGRLR